MLNIGFLVLFCTLPLAALAAPSCSLVPNATLPAVVRRDNSSQALPFVATTWYNKEHADFFPPDNISWEKYTSVTYAFATTNEDPSAELGNIDGMNDTDLIHFVNLAHGNNVKALLSIGGWTGSGHFSCDVGPTTNATNPSNATIFINNLVNLVSNYSLDGLDFVWEFPGVDADPGNVVNPNDSQNFLAFLQQLRNTTTMQNLTISASASITPFANSTALPMTNVSAFAEPLDYVTIMNFDQWGSWSPSVGPNAPLNDSCPDSPPNSVVSGSADSAVKAWIAADFPPEKLVLGVAAYGHSFSVNNSDANNTAAPSDAVWTFPVAAYPPFHLPQLQGDSLDAKNATDAGNYTGIFNFFGLIDEGFLDSNGHPVNGTGYRFDNCTQTPYVYNFTTGVMVSYDNAESFAAKGQFIQDKGLRGFAMWEAAGDRNDILLDAISQAAGC
ncbi:hypothetical protein EUX98_g3199 [Antrodiella citrinella]|uniref:GH18 domain-containing protein n=1 Tax=Antrodiella citrinella TaxID=2447956 RepID=A0A4S4MX82_9APHY|nr:hypothetical protein EUX98_g3199 [Antrodiella citrinella]